MQGGMELRWTHLRFRARLGGAEHSPEAAQALAAPGAPPPKPVVTERKPRAISKLPPQDQKLGPG
jgi:hypothetical protein